jgi:hypothetical protein
VERGASRPALASSSSSSSSSSPPPPRRPSLRTRHATLTNTHAFASRLSSLPPPGDPLVPVGHQRVGEDAVPHESVLADVVGATERRGSLSDARRAILSTTKSRSGAFYTLVTIRPRRRGERRSLRTFPGVSLRPTLAFNPRPRRLSTPPDAFQLHPDVRSYGTTLSGSRTASSTRRYPSRF